MHGTRVQEIQSYSNCILQHAMVTHFYFYIYVAHGIDFTDMKTPNFGFHIYISLLEYLQYKLIKMDV